MKLYLLFNDNEADHLKALKPKQEFTFETEENLYIRCRTVNQRSFDVTGRGLDVSPMPSDLNDPESPMLILLQLSKSRSDHREHRPIECFFPLAELKTNLPVPVTVWKPSEGRLGYFN